MFKPPAWEWTGFGEIGWWVRSGSPWRDVLLGPDGLRLDEWRAEGRLATVKAGPHRIVALISREAADELGLEAGARATASVKATNVTVGVPAG